MSRKKNDGLGRLGGRSKGTPNKLTSDLKAVVSDIVSANASKVSEDMAALKPYERLKIWERLLNYVLPKQQPIDADKMAEAEVRELERLINTSLSDEAAEKVAAKIMKMWEYKQAKPTGL